MVSTGSAAAEGERSPMLGGALTYTEGPDGDAALVGAALELAWWSGRFGLAFESAARRGVDDDARNLAVAGGLRVLVADWLTPSLFDARDVEIGIELQAIAERTWWSRDDSADALGAGLAIRMRGGSDWELSSLLAESRLFVRVMKSRDEVRDVFALATDDMAAAPAIEQPDRGVTVIVGLGAAFGTGAPRYLERFHRKSRTWLR
jgi:hypothetical protein